MTTTNLDLLPCIDSDERAAWARRTLDIERGFARELGLSAVRAIESGKYQTATGRIVDWSAEVARARSLRKSIRPDDPVPPDWYRGHDTTTVQVINATTFQASKALVGQGQRPLALNFANGISPGGGFLHGARAQEEVLCRSSALFATLIGDEMYEHHLARPEPDSTDWAIVSPQVPVFRDDAGLALDDTWLLDVITSAAPVAHRVGQPKSGNLLRQRIHRVLQIAAAEGFDVLVLGAWGCGAFGNDPHRTARDFRSALEAEFRGAFSHVVFAITDWSPARRTLGPFRDVFS